MPYVQRAIDSAATLTVHSEGGSRNDAEHADSEQYDLTDIEKQTLTSLGIPEEGFILTDAEIDSFRRENTQYMERYDEGKNQFQAMLAIYLFHQAMREAQETTKAKIAEAERRALEAERRALEAERKAAADSKKGGMCTLM